MGKMKRMQKRAEKVREAVRECARDIAKQKEGQGLIATAARTRMETLGREIAAVPDLKTADPIRYNEKLRAYGQAKDQIEQSQHMVDLLSGIDADLHDFLMQIDSMIILGLFRKLVRMVPLRKLRRLIKGERLTFLIQVDSVLKKTRVKVDKTILMAKAARNKALEEKKRRKIKRDKAMGAMGNAAANELAELEADIQNTFTPYGTRK